jgi:hypothetical protein
MRRVERPSVRAASAHKPAAIGRLVRAFGSAADFLNKGRIANDIAAACLTSAGVSHLCRRYARPPFPAATDSRGISRNLLYATPTTFPWRMSTLSRLAPTAWRNRIECKQTFIGEVASHDGVKVLCFKRCGKALFKIRLKWQAGFFSAANNASGSIPAFTSRTTGLSELSSRSHSYSPAILAARFFKPSRTRSI